MINVEFEKISDITTAFPTEQSCIDHLTRLKWEHFVVSPFDASSKIYHCPNNNYKCKNSGKYFNVKTNTLFHNSKIPLQQWFVAIWLVGEAQPNISSVALGKELNITQKTAWYIIKRIKTYYPSEKNNLFSEKSVSKTILKSKEIIKPEQNEKNQTAIVGLAGIIPN